MLIEVQDIAGKFRRDGSPQQLIKMSCDACGKIFERTDKRCLIIERHCCSLKCGKQFRPRTRYVELSCLVCETKFEKYIGYVKERNFCSKKCMYDHKRTHFELWPDNSDAMNTSEARESAKQTMEKLRESPDYVHPRLGRHHSEDSIQLIKDARAANPLIGMKNGMFGKHHREDSKEAMSDEHTKQIVAGTRKTYGKNNHKRGEFISKKVGKTFFYRSSWELAAMEYLDENESVSTYDYEYIRIPYLYSGNKRWYVPDFLVMFVDNHKEIWEIKPEAFLNTVATQLKSEAAKKYCTENGVESYKLLTKEILQAMGIL